METPISSTETAAPQPGQAAQAPAAAQAAQSSTQAGQTAAAQAQPPEISVQDILKAAQPTRSPEEELEFVKQQYGASSSEAKKLNEQLKAERAALAEQGLEPVYDKTGKFQGYKATEKFSKDLPALNLDDVSLTAKEKELLTEDPDKAIKSVISRVGERVAKAYTRAVPTIDKVVDPIAPERIAATHKFLAGMKDVDGELKFANYEKDAPIVDQLISQMPEGIRNAFVGNEALLVSLQYANLQHIRSGLSALAQRKTAQHAAKTEGAQREASVQVQGGGKAVIKDGLAGPDLARALLVGQ